MTTEAMRLMSTLVLENGKRWSEVALPEQHDNVRAVLDPPAGGPRNHYWLAGRGFGKTGDGAGVGLSLLLTEAPPRSRSFAYASDEDQAAIVLTTIAGYVERTGLGSLVEVSARTVTSRATGASLSIEPADAGLGLRDQALTQSSWTSWRRGRPAETTNGCGAPSSAPWARSRTVDWS